MVPAFSVLLAAGCASHAGPTHGEGSPAVHADAASQVQLGDWDDADAAVYGGVDGLGVAVTQVVPRSPTDREYLLRAMSGEDGMLVIERRTPPTEPPTPEPMTLRCSIGRLGDADLERQVVEAVSKRLGELRGREFAPRR